MVNTSSVIDFDNAARLYTRLMHSYFVYGCYKINLQLVYSLTEYTKRSSRGGGSSRCRTVRTRPRPSANGAENVKLIGREACLKLLVTLRTAVFVQLFDPGYDGVALGGVDGRKSLDARVDDVNNFLLGKFAVRTSGTSDGCSILAITKGEEAQLSSDLVGRKWAKARSKPSSCQSLRTV
jgi:hypothetical protein